MENTYITSDHFTKEHITAALVYATIVLWENWQVSDYGEYIHH